MWYFIKFIQKTELQVLKSWLKFFNILPFCCCSSLVDYQYKQGGHQCYWFSHALLFYCMNLTYTARADFSASLWCLGITEDQQQSGMSKQNEIHQEICYFAINLLFKLFLWATDSKIGRLNREVKNKCVFVHFRDTDVCASIIFFIYCTKIWQTIIRSCINS